MSNENNGASGMVRAPAKARTPCGGRRTRLTRIEEKPAMKQAPALASNFEIILNIISKFFDVLEQIFNFFGIPIPGEQS